MTPLRVLLLIDSRGVGGAERQARLLLTRMPRDRVESTLGCSGGQASELEAAAGAGVPAEMLPNLPRRLWTVRVLKRIREIALVRSIRIVQSFLPTFDFLTPLAHLILPGIGIVVSRRNVDEQLSPIRLRALRYTGRLADAIVANSQAVAASVQRLEGDPGDRLHFVLNGIVPPDPIDRVAGDSVSPTQTSPWSILRNYVTGKGIAIYPGRRSSSSLRSECAFPRRRGYESNRAYRCNASLLRETIVSRGLEAQVRLLNVVEDSRSLIAAGDVSLNLSDVEGTSNALIESMALGIPVVATDAGGAREMITDGVEGRIIPRGDSGAAAACLFDLARNTDLRRRLGSAACERIICEFSVERMVDSYAHLYERLAGI